MKYTRITKGMVEVTEIYEGTIEEIIKMQDMEVVRDLEIDMVEGTLGDEDG